MLKGRPCFAAPFRSRYLHGAEHAQITLDLSVHRAGKITLRLFERLNHDASLAIALYQLTVYRFRIYKRIELGFSVTRFSDFPLYRFGFHGN